MSGCTGVARQCDGRLGLLSACHPGCVLTNLTCFNNISPVNVSCVSEHQQNRNPFRRGNQTTFKVSTPCSYHVQESNGKCHQYFVCNSCGNYCAFTSFWDSCESIDNSRLESVTFLMKRENDGRCNNPSGCEVGTVFCASRDVWQTCLKNERQIPLGSTRRSLFTRPEIRSVFTRPTKTFRSTTPTVLPSSLYTNSSAGTPLQTPTQTPGQKSPEWFTSVTTRSPLNSTAASPVSIAITLGSTLGAACLLFLLALIFCLCHRKRSADSVKSPTYDGHSRIDEPIYSEPELPPIYDEPLSVYNPSYQKQLRLQDDDGPGQTSLSTIPYEEKKAHFSSEVLQRTPSFGRAGNSSLRHPQKEQPDVPLTDPQEGHFAVPLTHLQEEDHSRVLSLSIREGLPREPGPPAYDLTHSHMRYISQGNYDLATLHDIPPNITKSQQTLPLEVMGNGNSGYSLVRSVSDGSSHQRPVQISPPLQYNSIRRINSPYNHLYCTDPLYDRPSRGYGMEPPPLPRRNHSYYDNENFAHENSEST